MRFSLASTFALAITLLVGVPAPIATASTGAIAGNLATAAASAALAGNNDRRAARQAQRAADRARKHNQRVTSADRGRVHASGDRGNSRGGAQRDRGHDRRGSAHRGGHSRHRDSVRTHRRHSNHTSHHSRHRDRRHHSYSSYKKDKHDSGVHISIGSGIHFGAHSRHYDRRHRYYDRSHRYHHRRYTASPHYYDYYRQSRYYTPRVEREVVIIEKEHDYSYDDDKGYKGPTNYELRGVRGWDYLLHHEIDRAKRYFAELASTHEDAGLPKLGFGFAHLADGNIRNAAHGIRRAFEFDPYIVEKGPGVHGFEGLVDEFAASLEKRVDRNLTMTEDHWFVRAALLYFQGEYTNAMYALESAKGAGDHSRGLKALDALIQEKIEEIEQRERMYESR